MKKPSFANFLSDENGATAIEYALIAGIVSICIAGALTQISGSLRGELTDVASSLNNASE